MARSKLKGERLVFALRAGKAATPSQRGSHKFWRRVGRLAKDRGLYSEKTGDGDIGSTFARAWDQHELDEQAKAVIA